MAGTALRRRLAGSWQPAQLVDSWKETSSARTLRFDVAGWPGHLPGQHVDVRLTAADGYRAERSYSLSAPTDSSYIEISVQLVEDGEVSPYLVHDIDNGDQVEVRGPLGGWFVWRPDQEEPVLLVGGGSGVAPLVAILRAHRAASSAAPLRLIYSVRTPGDVYFAKDLHSAGSDVALLYTRTAADDELRVPHRIDPSDLAKFGLPPERRPTWYVCGPTPFVEAVTDMIIDNGHDPANVRAERFGSTGG